MTAKRILYIEDNFQNRRLVKKLLRLNGYEMIEAEDGLQGIAVAAREHPDMILMDINLPGIDGMEATSRLKSSSDLSHIPIVALTAAAMRGDRERIMAAGCDGYLQKPIDNVQLINTVRSFIGASEGDAASPRKDAVRPPAGSGETAATSPAKVQTAAPIGVSEAVSTSLPKVEAPAAFGVREAAASLPSGEMPAATGTSEAVAASPRKDAVRPPAGSGEIVAVNMPNVIATVSTEIGQTISSGLPKVEGLGPTGASDVVAAGFTTDELR